MHGLIPLEIYLPIAIVVFAFFLWFSARLSKRLTRSLLRGLVAALLFGTAGVPLGHGGAFVFPAWMMIVRGLDALAFMSIVVLPWVVVQAAIATVIFYVLDRMFPPGALSEEWRKSARELRALRSPTPTRPPVKWRWLLLPVVPVLVAGAIIATVVVMDMRPVVEDEPATWYVHDAPASPVEVEQDVAQWHGVACSEQGAGAPNDCLHLIVNADAVTGSAISSPAPAAGIATVTMDGYLPGGVQLLVVNARNGERVSLPHGREASIALRKGDRFYLAPETTHQVDALAPNIVAHEVEPQMSSDAPPP